jgi:putative Mg2+ transporter-C (MgtC) family protein
MPRRGVDDSWSPGGADPSLKSGMDGWNQRAWSALKDDFSDLVDGGQLVRLVVRLVVAAILGGLIGYERKQAGKDVGPRTHMLVAAGSALFVLIPQQAGMAQSDLSRVLQGLLAGIGFLGGGAILKSPEQGRVSGMTSAAGIWMVAAVGMAVGLGRLASAIVAAAFAYLVLSLLYRVERRLDGDKHEHPLSPRAPQSGASPASDL